MAQRLRISNGWSSTQQTPNQETERGFFFKRWILIEAEDELLEAGGGFGVEVGEHGLV